MKKVITIILILFLFIPLCGCKSNESTGNYEKFIGGKDTIITFGDGRFSVDYNDRDKPYYLTDRKRNCTVDFITKYCIVSPYLYAIGEKGYTKISYQLGVYYTSNILETFVENDQTIFKLLENSSETIHDYKSYYNKIQPNTDVDVPLVYLDNKGLYVVYYKKSNSYNRHYELTDTKNSKIIDYISKYKVFNSCIYAIGEQGYTKIDLSDPTKTYIQSRKLNDFSSDDQVVFKILEDEDSIFLELNGY